MKKFLTPIYIGLAFAATGQQLPQFSQYALNPFAYNPAYAGMENTLVVTGAYRKQWADLTGAPETQHLNVHCPINYLHSGAGFLVENDLIGAHRTTQVKVAYDYQLEFGQSTVVSLGASAGYLQYSLDGAKLRTPEGEYGASAGGVFSHEDPILPATRTQAGVPTVGLGVFLSSGKLVAGVAVHSVLSSAAVFSGDVPLQVRVQREYLATAGWLFKVSNSLNFKPSLAVKTDFRVTQAEFSGILNYRGNMLAGVSFRGISQNQRDALVLLGGIRLNARTFLTYSYDVTLSALGASNSGSHEIMLKYSLERPLGVGKLPPVLYNPRFF